MRVVRLSVRNFRNLADVSVPLSRGTVIVGENRSGKSNLVHALRLVLDPTLSSAQRTLRREDFWDGLNDRSPDWDPFVAGDIIEISVDIEDIDTEPAVLAALGLGVAETEPLTARLIYRFAPRDDLDQPEEGVKHYDWGIYGGDGDERIGGDLRRFLAHVYQGALRDVEDDLASWRRSPLRALIEEAAEQVDAHKLEEIGGALVAANRILTDLQPVTDLGQAIAQETEGFVGPQQALRTSLGLTPPEPLRILRSLRLFIDGAAQRPLSAASLGGLNVLYLALLELRLAQQLTSGEIAHVVLSIEEPEAHLHPHTQRLVFSRLLRGDATRTALVTTHSPHIVSVTPPQQIVVLRSVADRTTTAAAVEADLTNNEWADVARYLDATRGEMVFARKVLLVEGFSEQVLVPLIAASAGHDLDRFGISVCAIHGAHFEVYTRLLTALDIPWAVVTDGDPKRDDPTTLRGEQRAQRVLRVLGREGEDPADAGVFVGQVTLERDIYDSDDGNAEACREALASILSSVNADDELDVDEFLTKVKARKGRFAQRLAAQEPTLVAPLYIEKALMYLLDQ